MGREAALLCPAAAVLLFWRLGQTFKEFCCDDAQNTLVLPVLQTICLIPDIVGFSHSVLQCVEMHVWT